MFAIIMLQRHTVHRMYKHIFDGFFDGYLHDDDFGGSKKNLASGGSKESVKYSAEAVDSATWV